MADEAYLHRLPNEILLQIAGYLGANESQPHRLHHLCLVSKKMLPIAQSVLYVNAYLPMTCGCHPRVNPAVQLLRTLIQRPDLAAKVKALRFAAVNRSITKLYKQKNFALKPLRDECLQLLTRYGVKNYNPWRRCLLNDVESAYVGVLLTLLPNLDTLIFSLKETVTVLPCIEPLPALFGSPITATRMLISLQKTIKHVGVTDPGFLRDIRFINLKSLDLSRVDWLTLARMQGPKTIPCGKSIESLKISMSIGIMAPETNSDLGLSLRSLLEALGCANIKSLRIKMYDDGQSQGVDESFLCNDFFQSIGGEFTKLETLHIECDTEHDSVDWDYLLAQCQDPVLSFAQFPSLKHLRIPQPFLLNDDLDAGMELEELPDTLERLEILYPDSYIVEWVERFASMDMNPLPNLKVLRLQCREHISSSPDIFTSKTRRVWAMLKDYGIDCRISEDIGEEDKDLAAKYRNVKKRGGEVDETDETDEENDGGSDSDMDMELGAENMAPPKLYDPKVADMD